MTKVPGDQATRTQLLDELDTTFVVEAAAGTGKTTVLVERIVMMVRKGRARLSEIISVTFTEKAAGEMKLRLRTRLERAREEVTEMISLSFARPLRTIITMRSTSTVVLPVPAAASTTKVVSSSSSSWVRVL